MSPYLLITGQNQSQTFAVERRPLFFFRLSKENMAEGFLTPI